jgi:hypothetical protein
VAVAVGRCLPYHERTTFSPVAEILRQLAADPLAGFSGILGSGLELRDNLVQSCASG